MIRNTLFRFGPFFDAMWLAGVSAAEIAAHYGCSKTRVRSVARGRGLPRRVPPGFVRPIIRRAAFLASIEGAAQARDLTIDRRAA